MASWVETLLNQYGKLRLANDATMTDDLQKLLKDGRESAKAYQRTMLGAEFPGAEKAPGDDVIRIDSPDQHYHLPKPSTMGAIAKLALGVGLIATGAGVPVGAYLVASALKDQPTSTPASAPATTTEGTPTAAPADEATPTPTPAPAARTLRWVLELVPKN